MIFIQPYLVSIKSLLLFKDQLKKTSPKITLPEKCVAALRNTGSKINKNVSLRDNMAISNAATILDLKNKQRCYAKAVLWLQHPEQN